MAILSAKTKSEMPDIPPMLDRRSNGKASDVDALLARIAELEAQWRARVR
jgi:hypothetical protein